MSEAASTPDDGGGDEFEKLRDEFAEIPEEELGKLGAQSPSDSSPEMEQPPGLEESEMGMGGPDVDSVKVGEVYCRAMAVGGATVRDKWGQEQFDREAQVDEYYELATDLWLDRFFADWWRLNMAQPEEMSPGQGVVMMTSLFAILVALDDPTVVDGIMQEYDL